MSIRLNKALSELNIGLQTAVEFLEKRSELGEVKAEPSFKLTDAQYDALVGAFQQDKEVRNQAEKLLQKKPKEKKGKDESRAEKSHSSSTPQQYKPLGKIDLDSIGRKPAAQKSSPKTDKPETRQDSGKDCCRQSEAVGRRQKERSTGAGRLSSCCHNYS